MINRKLYQFIYFLGFILGPVISLWYFSSKSYGSFLFWWGIVHMAILIFAAFFVESEYKSNAGVDVQYGGYIWTLIGVGAILLSFGNENATNKLLNIFLHSSGLAVATSIIGWTFGRWLENRAQIYYVDKTQKAADDLVRTVDHLRKGLDKAGEDLILVIDQSKEDAKKLKNGFKQVNDTLEKISSNLGVSAVLLVNSLNNTKDKFDTVRSTAEQFHSSLSNTLNNVKTSADKFGELADNAQKLTTNFDSVATKIKTLADTVQEATSQSQRVIEQVGRFIDKVFDNKPNT